MAEFSKTPDITRLLAEEHIIVQRIASWLNPELWQNGQIPVPPCQEVNDFIESNRHKSSGPEERFSELALNGLIGFVVPCREFIETIKQEITQHSNGKIVEIGAGNGFLSALLQQAGIEVTATDLRASYLRHHPIVEMDVKDAMNAYPNHAILLDFLRN